MICQKFNYAQLYKKGENSCVHVKNSKGETEQIVFQGKWQIVDNIEKVEVIPK